jgi:hypothetical protein
MKTLIIHPLDNSTWFLYKIYENIEDKTVITGNVTKNRVRELIAEHDRVIMMGHGSPNGLFSVGQFEQCDNGYIIDRTMLKELYKKDNNVYIWCNADIFVNYYLLEGYYTGMFISEVGEANYCGLPGMSQEIVDESNFGYTDILTKHINEDKFTLHKNVNEEYSKIAETNPVASYNYKRLYVA